MLRIYNIAGSMLSILHAVANLYLVIISQESVLLLSSLFKWKKLRIRVSELLTQVSEIKFQSYNALTASHKKENCQVNFKRCFKSAKVFKERSFHAGIDFRCNINFENQ